MAKVSLAKMSIEALLQLRSDVEVVLRGRAKELSRQLSQLNYDADRRTEGRGSALKGRKVPAKYRDRAGNTWAGRGAMPVWLREKIKAGAKLQDFAVDKKIASQRKAKNRRRAKR
jgi:DNA-binding protein H-NS